MLICSSGSSDEESVLLRKQAAAKKGAGGKQAKKAEGAAGGGLYESNRSTVPVQAAGGATYTTEIDTEHDRDQRAMLEMAIQAQQEGEWAAHWGLCGRGQESALCEVAGQRDGHA